MPWDLDESRHLGERLRQLREERGLTQEGLAARSGIGKNVVQDLERGSKTKAGVLTMNNPKAETLYGLAEGLGVHPADLLPR